MMIILHSLFPLPPTRSSPQLCDGLINALYLEKNMPLRSSLLLCQRWVTHAGQVQERPERALISASVPAYMATSAPRNQSSVVSRELLLSCAALLREVILRTCSTHTHTHTRHIIYLSIFPFRYYSFLRHLQRLASPSQLWYVRCESSLLYFCLLSFLVLTLP